MRITVKTGNADKPGPDITDNLLSSTESLIARGKSALFGSVDAYQHTVLMPLQTLFKTGQIAEIQDNQYGESYRTKVEGVTIEIDENGIDIKLDMERPA